MSGVSDGNNGEERRRNAGEQDVDASAHTAATTADAHVTPIVRRGTAVAVRRHAVARSGTCGPVQRR